jgi:hypothetical protein
VRPHDPVPFGQFLAERVGTRSIAKRDDAAHHLVAEDKWQRFIGAGVMHGTVAHVHIGPAQGGDLRAHEDRAILDRVGDRHVNELQGLAGRDEHGRPAGCGLAGHGGW